MDHLGSAASDQARRAAGRLGDLVYENPFAFAAVGLAVGAAVGFLLPETRRENELMGETRDTLLDKAKATATDAMKRVQHVAEAATDAATEEAQRQNLTVASLSGQAAQQGRSLLDKAERVVESAAAAGKEEAKRYGQSPESSRPPGSERAPGVSTGSSTAAPAKPETRQEGCGP
jgi:ElaB/YqjD/DUF883 family membrane-anchored ribosome-binding protein